MAARLPTPGADSNAWGQILNDFMAVEHTSDGTLKLRTDAALTGRYIKPSGGIPASDLDSGVQVSLTKANNAPTALTGLSDVTISGPADSQVLSYNTSSGKWIPATVSSTTVNDAGPSNKGIVQLAGALTGTAAVPVIASAAIADAQVAPGAAIAQSKVNNLVSDLAATEKTANKGAASGYAGLNSSSRVLTAQLGSGTASSTTYLRGDSSWTSLPTGNFADIVAFGALVDNSTDDYQAWVDAIASVATTGGMVGSSRPGRSLINLLAHSSSGISVPTGVILIGQGTHQAPAASGGQTKQLSVRATGSYAGSDSAVFRTSGFEAGMKHINVYAGAIADYAVYTGGAEEIYEDISFAGGKVATWKVASGANTSQASIVRLLQDQTSNRTVDAMCLDHAGIDWQIFGLAANNGGGPTVPNCRFAGSVTATAVHLTSGGAGGILELASGQTTSMFDDIYFDGCANNGPFLHIKSGAGTSTSFGQALFFQSGSGLTGSTAVVIDSGASSPAFVSVNLKAGVSGSAFAAFITSANSSQMTSATVGTVRGSSALTGGVTNLWNNAPGHYAYFNSTSSTWTTSTGSGGGGGTAKTLTTFTPVSGTTTLAATAGQVVLVDATAISGTITLPTPASAIEVEVKKVDANTSTTVTVQGSSVTIDGLSTFVLSYSMDAVRLMSDGTNWWVLA